MFILGLATCEQSSSLSWAERRGRRGEAVRQTAAAGMAEALDNHPYI